MKINNIHGYNTNFCINNNNNFHTKNNKTYLSRLSAFRGVQFSFDDDFYQTHTYLLPERKTKEEALKILSKYGITEKNIDDPMTDEGHTRLMMAAPIEIIQLLIDAGADVNKKDKYGRTALIYAKLSLVTYILLKAGADSTIVDIDGRNALNSSTSDEQTALIIKDLRKKGEDTLHHFVNLPDKSGRPPLMFADSTTQAQMLLDAGADPNAKCNGEYIINLIRDEKIKQLLRNAGAKEFPCNYSLLYSI